MLYSERQNRTELGTATQKQKGKTKMYRITITEEKVSRNLLGQEANN